MPLRIEFKMYVFILMFTSGGGGWGGRGISLHIETFRFVDNAKCRELIPTITNFSISKEQTLILQHTLTRVEALFSILKCVHVFIVYLCILMEYIAHNYFLNLSLLAEI